MSHFSDEIKSLLAKFESSVLSYLSPAAKYIEQNGGKLALNLAENVLKAAVAGTPWGVIVATLLTEAEQAGIAIAEGAAGVILNTAQSSLIVNGELPAPVPTAPATTVAAS